MSQFICHIYPEYLDKQAFANSVDPDQMPQNVVSDLGHIICHLFGSILYSQSAGNKIDLFNFCNKYA